MLKFIISVICYLFGRLLESRVTLNQKSLSLVGDIFRKDGRMKMEKRLEQRQNDDLVTI